VVRVRAGATAVSRFAFVNPGGPQVPDIAKAKRYGITRLYFEAHDPQISAGLLAAIRDRQMEVGIMRDPSWQQEGAIDLARQLDADLVRLGSGNAQCAVLTDIEYHDAAYVMAFLREWRDLRPKRVTGWTLEPMQGGWITKDLCAAVLSAQVTVFPQAFFFDMAPAPPDPVRSQLINAGIPRGMVALCYDGAHIPTWWDGLAFRFEQMP
jgi:hypothetical protein